MLNEQVVIFIKERIGNGNSRESSFAYAKDEKKKPKMAF